MLLGLELKPGAPPFYQLGRAPRLASASIRAAFKKLHSVRLTL